MKFFTKLWFSLVLLVQIQSSFVHSSDRVNKRATVSPFDKVFDKLEKNLEKECKTNKFLQGTIEIVKKWKAAASKLKPEEITTILNPSASPDTAARLVANVVEAGTNGAFAGTELADGFNDLFISTILKQLTPVEVVEIVTSDLGTQRLIDIAKETNNEEEIYNFEAFKSLIKCFKQSVAKTNLSDLMPKTTGVPPVGIGK